MTERQIKALNSLYAATIEVMDSFAPDMVDANMRRETVSRLLENFLLGASSLTNAGQIQPTSERKDSGIATQKPVTEAEHLNSGKPTPEDTQAPFPPDVHDDANAVVAYVEGPTDGSFKRPKSEDEKDAIVGRALADGDPVPRFNYKLYLVGDSHGTFELVGGGKEDINIMMRDYDVTEGVTELTADSVSSSSASFVETVERGEIVKEGKRWRVSRKARIRFKS